MSESTPPDPLARLGKEIDKARAERVRRQPQAADRSTLQQGLGLGFRIGIELVVAVVVATAIGWAIDRWFGTRPWGLLVFLFLGIGAGMTNVYRVVKGLGMTVGYKGDGPGKGERNKVDWDDDED